MPPTKISIWSKNHVVRSKILLIDFFWMKKRNHSLDFLYAFNIDIQITFQELRYVVLRKKSKLWIWCSINRISNKKRKFISHELGISFFFQNNQPVVVEDIELYSHRQRQLFWIVRQWKIWKQQVNRQMICLLLIFQCPFWIPHLKPLHPRNEATHGRKKTRYLEAPIRALWYNCNQDLPVLLMQFVCSIHKTSEIIDARHSF